MTDKQIIIDGYNLEYIKELLYNGQRSAISTNIFEAIIEELERKEQECKNLEGEISHYEHDLGWCSSLIDVYEEKIMKCFYALHQIQLHNLKIKDKDIHLILKEVKEELKEYNKMKNEELDKKVKGEKGV